MVGQKVDHSTCSIEAVPNGDRLRTRLVEVHIEDEIVALHGHGVADGRSRCRDESSRAQTLACMTTNTTLLLM